VDDHSEPIGKGKTFKLYHRFFSLNINVPAQLYAAGSVKISQSSEWSMVNGEWGMLRGYVAVAGSTNVTQSAICGLLL
jgi:hypothetical protein